MADGRYLNPALLDELSSRWAERGAYVSAALRPGISEATIDELTAAVGIRLPREARLWWGWHDGAGPQDAYEHAAELGPGKQFLSLSQAVQQCQENRAIMLELYQDDYGPDWQPGWLPMTGGEYPLVLDCSVGDEEPVPVYWFSFEAGDYDKPDALSIGDVVSTWLELIDRGVWVYERDDNRWAYNPNGIDRAFEHNRLI